MIFQRAEWLLVFHQCKPAIRQYKRQCFTALPTLKPTGTKGECMLDMQRDVGTSDKNGMMRYPVNLGS